MFSLNGTEHADVSVAGIVLLDSLSECQDNLQPSGVTPQAVNGTIMRLVGKLQVNMSLGEAEFTDEIHIYPEVRGTLISWKAARGLGILQDCYPQPIRLEVAQATSPSDEPQRQKFMREFPLVFKYVEIQHTCNGCS